MNLYQIDDAVAFELEERSSNEHPQNYDKIVRASILGSGSAGHRNLHC